MKSRSLYLAAVHEAAHAVAAFHLRVELQPIILPPLTNPIEHLKTGSVEGTKKHLERRVLAEHRVIVALAGLAAERHAKGQTSLGWGDVDRSLANQIVAGIPMEQREALAFLKWLEIRTEGLMRIWWPIIEAVAAALMERKRLSTVALRELIQAHGEGIALPLGSYVRDRSVGKRGGSDPRGVH